MQYQLPTMSKNNKIIVIGFVTFFILNAIVAKTGVHLSNYLGISPGGVLSGYIWSFITYVLIPNSLMECLFDALIFWFIGSELENIWGGPRYLTFLLLTALGASLIYLIVGFLFFTGSPLFSVALTGPAGLASTLCVAYGILFPKRTMYFFLFPMEARWFVLILVGMNLYSGFLTPGGIFAWAQLGAMLSGVSWMLAVSNPELKKIFKSKSGPSKPETPFARSKKRSNKISHLHIVEDSEGEDDDNNTPPTYH